MDTPQDEETLREECEGFLASKLPHASITSSDSSEWHTITYGVIVDELLAFAKEQRAAGDEALRQQITDLQTVGSQQVERIRALERQVADVTNERNAQMSQGIIRMMENQIQEAKAQLAAMTQELDECEKRCNAICTPDLINHLRQQLAARDARIQEFESDGHVSRAENQRLRTKALEAEAAYDQRSKQLALARTALEDDYIRSLKLDINQLQATVEAQQEEMRRCAGSCKVRR